MKFENGKHDEKVSGKLPEWRASDGIYREKIVSKNKSSKREGQEEGEKDETLKGYIPSLDEKKNKNAPKKIMDIENSYGTLSIGVNDKKQLVTLTTQRRSREVEVMRSESKELKGASAINLQKVPGKALTNSSRKKDSAVEYINDAHRQVPFLLDRVGRFTEIHNLEVQEDLIPFMSLRDDKIRLKDLREKRKELAKTNGDSKSKNLLENEIEYFDSILRDKEQELQRTRRRFMSIRKEALDQTDKDYTDRLLAVLNGVEPATEDGTEDNAEEGAEDGEENSEENNTK